MKKLIFLSLLFGTIVTNGQTSSQLSVIDFVKIKGENHREALFFYENNWKVYRDTALKKGYIKSYKLLTTLVDTTANFDLMLITEYLDSAQLKVAEERFQQIIKEIRPNGPLLLNERKPNEFRKNVFLKTAKTAFSSIQ